MPGLVTTALVQPRRQRLGKKEKLRLKQQLETTPATAPATTQQQPTTTTPWFNLAQPSTATCPVLFTPDSSYCFISSGSSVKIYDVASAQLLSTLSPPAAVSAPSGGSVASSKVTCVLLHPTNPLQLIVASLDGLLRFWDYTEGKLLRTLDLGAPIQHACGHETVRDQLFVALVAGDAPASKESDEGQLAGVYLISLKPRAGPGSTVALLPSTPRTPSRRMRLAHPRLIRSLAVSPSGTFLISINPHSINICRTTKLPEGFSVQLPSTEALTAFAFHPTESYFATGNEVGKIRMWYGVLEEEEGEWIKVVERSQAGISGESNQDSRVEERGTTATAVFHWHAHAVASLAFTPNGAYLLSGGEEAVLVLWQLHTGHKEFVPRLGAPIVTLSITDTSATEQQVAARLRDGTVIFVGSQKLKISRTISGLKADAIQLADLSNTTRHVPLAVQPLTKSLVVPAGHPSSLQFYSIAEDSPTFELEVSPSNRTSGTDKTTIVPTRVDRVAFSTPNANGEYWMATADSWTNRSYAPSRHLKFWKYRPEEKSFTLVTRIDRPHTSSLTSLTFSPLSSSPLLLTTSTDGRIKLWSHQDNSWGCRSSLTYRSFTPRHAAWSHDGSTFAVAYPRAMTLWSLSSNTLIHAFTCGDVAPARTVEFLGKEGTVLLAAGKKGVMAWDLLTFEESLHMSLEVNDISIKPSSAIFLATSDPTTSASDLDADASSAPPAFLFDASVPSCSAQSLPFPVRQSCWIPTSSSSSPSSSEMSLAVVNEQGDVVLVGAAVAAALGRVTPSARLPSARKGGQGRLFDEIFGEGGRARVGGERGEKSEGRGKGREREAKLGVLEMPAQTLPPVRLLWRSMMDGLAVPLKKEEEERVVVVDEAGRVRGERKEDEGEKVQSQYTTSPGSLADTFRVVLSLGTGQ